MNEYSKHEETCGAFSEFRGVESDSDALTMQEMHFLRVNKVTVAKMKTLICPIDLLSVLWNVKLVLPRQIRYCQYCMLITLPCR